MKNMSLMTTSESVNSAIEFGQFSSENRLWYMRHHSGHMPSSMATEPMPSRGTKKKAQPPEKVPEQARAPGDDDPEEEQAGRHKEEAVPHGDLCNGSVHKGHRGWQDGQPQHAGESTPSQCGDRLCVRGVHGQEESNAAERPWQAHEHRDEHRPRLRQQRGPERRPHRRRYGGAEVGPT
eukprot:CAMPEP_0175339662 /NCGR_PEP_ID=MMETSP0095-20121207/5448_1 /TAXON_ID=311494 /ORGANISM="Alexandrium monilatum, Strain CCMP3105" /LENGTH=178 /DNA_ID=CAMNT_0016637067 /DNA_START=139 /DNA_END=671 /DNA_ORIENTATION=+